MGRGGGGGGKGGGGGGGGRAGAKGMGGGGSAGAPPPAAKGVPAAPQKPGDKQNPAAASNVAKTQDEAFEAIGKEDHFWAPNALDDAQVAKLYDDLPDAGDGGRIVGPDGAIRPPTAGAPSLPSDLPDATAARAKLDRIGMPPQVIDQIEAAGGLREIAAVLPDNAKVMGRPGVEGVGVDVGGGKVWRVQYDGSERPVPAYDIGKFGVYPEWEQKYGGTWITQKEKMVGTALDAKNRGGLAKHGAVQSQDFLREQIQKARPRPTYPGLSGGPMPPASGPRPWDFGDMHLNNLGPDSKGRWRLLDQGGAVPEGAPQFGRQMRQRNPASFAASAGGSMAQRIAAAQKAIDAAVAKRNKRK